MPEPSRLGTRAALPRLGLVFALTLAASAALAQDAPLEPGGAPLCVPDAHTLCLDGGRFAVTAAFQLTPEGPSAQATAVALTEDSGYFWFFDASNVEVIVKVLDGCGTNNAYWVFASGLTNVGVGIAVRDLRSGLTQTYTNPPGTPFAPIQDTGAFGTCP